jgi:transposase-like protein
MNSPPSPPPPNYLPPPSPSPPPSPPPNFSVYATLPPLTQPLSLPTLNRLLAPPLGPLGAHHISTPHTSTASLTGHQPQPSLPKTLRQYSDAFKAEVFKYWLEPIPGINNRNGHKTLKDVSRELGIPLDTIKKWAADRKMEEKIKQISMDEMEREGEREEKDEDWTDETEWTLLKQNPEQWLMGVAPEVPNAFSEP